MPLCPYRMPPAQIVSPTHWSTPYFKGIEMSVAKASTPPIRTVFITYLAPSSALRRSVVAVTLVFRPETSIILRRIFAIMSRFVWLMSVSAISIPSNSGTFRMSEQSLRVKPTLPAPMMQSLNGMVEPPLAKRLGLPAEACREILCQSGNFMLSALLSHGHDIRVLSARGAVPSLGVLAEAVGYEQRRNELYSWDGMKRGTEPFLVIQHTILGEGRLDFASARHRLHTGQTMLVTMPPCPPLLAGAWGALGVFLVHPVGP